MSAGRRGTAGGGWGGGVRLAVVLALAASSAHGRPLRVVATSPTFADLVREVGGPDVEVSAISPPCDDIHFIEPKPSDILRLARADAFAHAGLDLELWRGPLVEASRNRAVFQGGPGEIDLSRGVRLLEVPSGTLSRSGGDIHVFGNPHYWMDPDNLTPMTGTIAEVLAGLGAEHAAGFEQRRTAFLARVAAADEGWRKTLEPYRGRGFVAYHRDWPYFADHFGLRSEEFLEPKPNITPSARHLQEVIAAMGDQGLVVVVREPFHPEKTVATVLRATGAREAVLAQHTGCLPHSAEYVAMMQRNVEALARAFAGGEGP